MLLLARVGHVNDAPRAHGLHPVFERRQVGRRVQVAPVALPNHERRAEALQEDAQRSVALPGDAPRREIRRDLGQETVVEALAHLLQADVEKRVVLLELAARDIADDAPYGHRLRVAGLQLHDLAARRFGELRICVEARLRGAVELLQVADGEGLPAPHGLGIRAAQVLDQHAELRAPVADVVDPADIVAARLQQPADRIADDRRADVADVHLLGDVRAGEVDDDRLAHGGGVQTQARVAGQGAQFRAQKAAAHGEVDEARAGGLDPAADVAEIQACEHLPRQFARIALEPLGEAHDAVGLEIAEALILGGLHRRGGVRNPRDGRERFRDPPVQPFNQ